MDLNLKSKFVVVAGALLIAGTVLTGAGFAAHHERGDGRGDSPRYTHGAGADRGVKYIKITQAEADVIKLVDELHKTQIDKLKADAKVVIDQAIKDGKITQERANQLIVEDWAQLDGQGDDGEQADDQDEHQDEERGREKQEGQHGANIKH